MKITRFNPDQFRPDPKPEKQQKKPQSSLKRTAINPKRKPTGEAKVFEEIWSERIHVSFVSGENLGGEAKTFFFAHVLPKSLFPAFRLYKSNIVLLTQEEHHQFDMCPISEIENDPKWKPLLILEKELRQDYRLKNRKK